LSSQRTTATPELPGHSFHFTVSFGPCQPASPGSCHPDPVRPASEARNSTQRR